MTAREYISQLRQLDIRINQKLEEISDLREKATATGGLDYSKEPVQTSPGTDARYAGVVQKIVDLEAEADRDIDALTAMMEKADAVCREILENEEYEIIRLRYFRNRKWTDIMGETGCANRTLFRIHEQALEKLEAQDVVV